MIELDINGPPGSSGKVNLQIVDVCSRLSQQLPAVLVDLIEIAAYVYCADQYVTRGTERMSRMGADWRRDFIFHVPVRCRDTWQSEAVLSPLVDVLRFLSEDEYHFEFDEFVNPRDVGNYFDFAEGRRGFQADEIMLFSGGLDSFAGAVEEIIGHGKHVALVSHESSSFVKSKQATLVDALRRSERGRLLHVPVAVNKNHEEGREYTQRSRSFLFASLAFAVATMFGRKRVRFYENGIVSLNLPIVEHVVGARATRTTHPQVLAGFGRLFSALSGGPIIIENPYFWKTKQEVIEVIARHGCEHLIAETFSCAKVREATQTQKHCGVCSQCIDRRFGILAAGIDAHEPAANYAVDLLADERQPGHEVVMAEGYVMSAMRIARMSEFAFYAANGQSFRALRHLPGSPDDNARAIYELHRRHAKAVVRVIERGVADLASRLTDQSLPETCLASLIVAPVARPPSNPEADEAEVRPLAYPVQSPG
ncbi:MAG: 7-cyano-7-deazaguanine synthase [Rhodospirillales bacterium]|nr:7-cyano-7-deazaguanine synthase [Rhodospirillales bacterium]